LPTQTLPDLSWYWRPSLSSENEIRESFKLLHDELTERYYKDPDSFIGGKIAFDAQHATIWLDMAKALVDAGYIEKPSADISELVGEIRAWLDKNHPGWKA